MMYSCISETIQNSGFGYLIWSNKCIPLSIEVIILSSIYLYYIGKLFNYIFKFLSQKTLVKSFMDYIEIDENDYDSFNLSKLIVLLFFLGLCGIYLVSLLASSLYFSDYILNFFDWSIDKRFEIFK